MAVNPVTNKIYVANWYSGNVTVIEELEQHASPPATTIMPLPQNRALGSESLFTFEVTSATGVTPRDIYYQLDTWTGPWQRAVPTGVPGRWQGQVAHPFPGMPILYAFAIDGQEATSVNTGQGSSPIIGGMVAYLFQVQPGTTHISITGHTPEPSYVGQPVEVSFALSVEPPAGGTPTGVVTVTDGAAGCTATLPTSSCSLTLCIAGTLTWSLPIPATTVSCPAHRRQCRHTACNLAQLALPSSGTCLNPAMKDNLHWFLSL